MTGGNKSEEERAHDERKFAMAEFIQSSAKQLGLSKATRKVGALICICDNFFAGHAWPSETHLAKRLDMDVKTVKRAVAALTTAGVIMVERSGRKNLYRPVYEVMEKGTNVPNPIDRKGTNVPYPEAKCPPSDEAERGHLSGNRGHLSKKQGTFVPLLRTTKVTSTAREDRAGAPEGAGGDAAFMAGLGETLRVNLGDAVFRSWLSKLGLERNDDDALVLSAPDQLVASRVKRDYERHILIAAGRDGGRLEIVVRERRASSPPGAVSLSDRRAAGSPDEHWLDTMGAHVVFNRLLCDTRQAVKTIDEWKRFCRDDLGALRRLITEGDVQQLEGSQFNQFVRHGLRQLRNADQLPLKGLAFTSVKRSAG